MDAATMDGDGTRHGQVRAAPSDITVVILTYNEDIHIERAIASVKPFAHAVVVVDSFSTDRTVELARAAGARVEQHRFVNYAQQFAWALEAADAGKGWILRLDADEVIEPDLAAEIARRFPLLEGDVVGVNFARKHVFMGRWIRHGGRYPLMLLRLWRAGHGRIENRWMDEHIVTWGGRTVTFTGGFADINERDLTFFTAKHNGYATREAIDVLARRYDLLPDDHALSGRNASRQAHVKRMVKERVYNRLPMWAGPLGYFLYRYVVQLGFLDGRPGLIYHLLQGFWYRFLVAAKIEEYELVLRGLSDAPTRRAALSRLTGYDLSADPGG